MAGFTSANSSPDRQRTTSVKNVQFERERPPFAGGLFFP